MSNRRFFRSVRLERDFDDLSSLEGYLLTPQVRHTLSQIEEGLRPQSSERAWTLTGPYGSGKSAFVLFLSHLLASQGQESKLAHSILAAQDPDLAQRFSETTAKGALLPVVLTLRRAPLAVALAEGLLQSLERSNLPKSKSLVQKLRHALTDGLHDTRQVLSFFEELQRLLSKKHIGVLLVLDELGKSLEYATRHPGEDIYLLQELAESAARSQEHPLLVIGVLHQGFEQYEESLDLSARKEWAKVQGRFRNLAFIEPPEQQMRLATQAIATLNLNADASLSGLQTVVKNLIDAGYTPNGLKPSEFSELATQAYPLHPVTLAALPHLFRRFAQNERSLFAYLLSQEPFGLQDLLQSKNGQLVRLADLFDYFMANLGGSLLRQSSARRWLEISDALERNPSLSAFEVELLKTIGVLGILGEASSLQATQTLVALALEWPPDSPEIAAVLQALQNRSLLVFRRYNQSYKIWEGSDVDIEARLEEGRLKTTRLSLAEVLDHYLPKRPLVARRHSYESGAIRYFEMRYLDKPLPPEQLSPSPGADGVVVCCLAANSEQAKTFVQWASSPNLAQAANLVVVVPQQISSLREVASEYAALHWVLANTPELRDDRIAKRELAERMVAIERTLAKLVDYLMNPKPEPQGAAALWIYQGQPQPLSRPKDATQLLSVVMDKLYHSAPLIKNELVNRRALSSAAAAARRTLIELMIKNEGQAQLGLSGFPPERSIYESVLLVSGLHRPNLAEVLPEPSEAWGFGPPPATDSRRLQPVWAQMQQRVFAATTQPLSVKELFDELAAPPFGVMPGVMPILFAAFLLAYPNETSLYRENVFLPEPNIADLEVLMRRPELFGVAGSRIRGERALVIERMAHSLKTPAAVVPVVRALIRMVRSFPDTAWRTQQLDAPILELRAAFERARSPEKLLFIDLPQALNEAPFSEDEPTQPQRIEQFFSKLNSAIQSWSVFAPQQVNTARDTLLKACGLPSGPQGWHQLRQLGQQLHDKQLSPALRPFVNRLCVAGDDTTVLEGVLALVANRPPKSWTDADIAAFADNAQTHAKRLREASHLLGVLTESEQAQSQQLVLELQQRLGSEVPAHVLKVALAQLLQAL